MEYSMIYQMTSNLIALMFMIRGHNDMEEFNGVLDPHLSGWMYMQCITYLHTRGQTTEACPIYQPPKIFQINPIGDVCINQLTRQRPHWSQWNVIRSPGIHFSNSGWLCFQVGCNNNMDLSYNIYWAVCIQPTHFAYDDYENMYTLSYYHHQIGIMKQWYAMYDFLYCYGVTFRWLLYLIQQRFRIICACTKYTMWAVVTTQSNGVPFFTRHIVSIRNAR